eukprot:COSAG05_NODE_2624_length_2830_cov_2.644819_2_plen_153_part_00
MPNFGNNGDLRPKVRFIFRYVPVPCTCLVSTSLAAPTSHLSHVFYAVKWWERCGSDIESSGYGYGADPDVADPDVEEDPISRKIFESKYLLCGGGKEKLHPTGYSPHGSPCQGGIHLWDGFLVVRFCSATITHALQLVSVSLLVASYLGSCH